MGSGFPGVGFGYVFRGDSGVLLGGLVYWWLCLYGTVVAVCGFVWFWWFSGFGCCDMFA